MVKRNREIEAEVLRELAMEEGFGEADVANADARVYDAELEHVKLLSMAVEDERQRRFMQEQDEIDRVIAMSHREYQAEEQKAHEDEIRKEEEQKKI
jgi:hypothetical protein